MVEKIKHRLRRTDDHGSSFVLVIVATTFLCVLASAILMGALMTYKLKYYKLNSLNNFYEVEKALDEIYAGVGATVNEHMYSAYTTTAELVVTYDTTNKKYTTIDNETANQMFKRFFMTGFSTDDDYKSLKSVTRTLQSFISNQYDKTNNAGGVRLVTDNMQVIYTAYADDKTDKSDKNYIQSYSNGVVKPVKDPGFKSSNIKKVTFKNVCLKRTVELAGANAATTSGKYEQSITTDIVLTEPEYNVSFTADSVSTDELYNYAILADMGIEIGKNDGTTATDVTINGNVYAASDYYNKGYNDSGETKVTFKYDTIPSIQWGTTDRSIYSGIFVNGEKSKLTMNSDVVVCSGSLAAYNGASIKLMGRKVNASELWTDNIVIGGTEKGGSITASANAYVYDDTELNAENSSLKFNKGSNYMGYSYKAEDTRNIDFLKDKGLASNFELKSHFSDSAIIVNGADSTLDIEDLSSLYIAGKSYIEFSKLAKKDDSTDEDGESKNSETSYEYTTLKDYSTGQSIDVKSNQLIFLTQWTEVKVDDEDKSMATIRFPYVNDPLRKLYSEYLNSDDETYAIKQTVSGHDYYYLYIPDKMSDDGSTVIETSEERAQKFAEDYYKYATTHNEAGVYNVRNYKNFKVTLLLPDNEKINTSGLVTDQYAEGEKPGYDNWLYFKEKESTTFDVKKNLETLAANRTFSTMLGNGTALNADEAKDAIDALDLNAQKNTADYQKGSSDEANHGASTLLSYMYINMKDHLSVNDKEVTKVDSVDPDKTTTETVDAWTVAKYKTTGDGSRTYDYSITPLNNYVNYKSVVAHAATNEKLTGTDYYIIINGKAATTNVVDTGDVKVSTSDPKGELKGIIIATGDVRFDSSVKSFVGMIITGGKVIIDHDMTISADNAMMASILSKCSASTDSKFNTLTNGNDKILKNYVAIKNESSTTDTGISITDISYEDILVFENWKKNVE